MNYYLDVDPFVCAWTQELIKDGLIPPGKVDCRSITEVTPDDLKGYTQHHFFNGISGWSRALALAGWSRTRPVWSASLPCQSFSCAGKGKGFDDPRGQLWFPFYELVKACHPVCIVGEQVPAAIGKGWLDRVFADLEKEGYACWPIVLGAHSVGAPQKRERLYWMAHAERGQRGILRESFCTEGASTGDVIPRELCGPRSCGLAHPASGGQRTDGGAQRGSGYAEQLQQTGDCQLRMLEISNRDGSASGLSGQDQWKEGGTDISDDSGDRRIARERERERETVWLVYAKQQGLEGYSRHEHDGHQSRWIRADSLGSATEAGTVTFWSHCQFIRCKDGKTRRVSPQPSLWPLVARVPGRVGMLRGTGNSINAETAAAFLRAFLSAEQDLAVNSTNTK